MNSSDSFEEKIKADVNNLLNMKAELQERADEVRFKASKHLHSLQAQVRRAYDDGEDGAPALEAQVNAVSQRILMRLDRIANL